MLPARSNVCGHKIGRRKGLNLVLLVVGVAVTALDYNMQHSVPREHVHAFHLQLYEHGPCARLRYCQCFQNLEVGCQDLRRMVEYSLAVHSAHEFPEKILPAELVCESLIVIIVSKCLWHGPCGVCLQGQT